MKRSLFILTGAIFLSLPVWGQFSGWKLSKITDSNRVTVGHIYHTDAKSENNAIGLRLVCAAPTFTIKGNNDPMIVLFWDQMTGNIPQMVEIKIDGKQIGVGQEFRWDQDGNILLRSINESRPIIQGMKTGRSIRFQWGPSNKTRIAVFDLRDFNSNLAEFNKVCQTNL